MINRTGMFILLFLNWGTITIFMFPPLRENFSLIVGNVPGVTGAALATAGVMSLILHSVLLVAWNSFFERPFMRPMVLVVALLSSMACGIIGTASWMAFTDAGIIRNMMTAQNTDTVSIPLQEFSDKTIIQTTLLSGLANKREQVEARRGGSCGDDLNPTINPSKIYKLRRQQSELFAEHAQSARQIARKADTIFMNLLSGRLNTDLNSAYLAASHLLKDPLLSNMNVTLNQQAEGFDLGWHDALENRKFICADEEMQIAIKDLIKVLTIPFALPTTAPIIADVGAQDILRAAVQKITSFFDPSFAGSKTKTPSNIGLFLAFAIQLILIWKIHINNMAKKRISRNQLPSLVRSQSS